MKKLKLYLAHNFNNRHNIRLVELYLEETYGIELLNPFFDQDRNDLVMSKKNNRQELIRKFKKITDKQCEEIAERDLNAIRKCDGILSVIDEASIGTSMELIICAYIYRMPVYIVTETYNHHPWLRYMAKLSNGKIFSCLREFEQWLEKRNKND